MKFAIFCLRMAAVAAPLQARQCPAVFWIKQNHFWWPAFPCYFTQAVLPWVFSFPWDRQENRGEQTGTLEAARGASGSSHPIHLIPWPLSLKIQPLACWGSLTAPHHPFKALKVERGRRKRGKDFFDGLWGGCLKPNSLALLWVMMAAALICFLLRCMKCGTHLVLSFRSAGWSRRPSPMSSGGLQMVLGAIRAIGLGGPDPFSQPMWRREQDSLVLSGINVVSFDAELLSINGTLSKCPEGRTLSSKLWLQCTSATCSCTSENQKDSSSHLGAVGPAGL